MWKTVCDQISEALHYPFQITHKQQIANSSADKLFAIGDGKHKYFVKVAPLAALERLECESADLKLLTSESLFLIPDCICTGSNLEFSFNVIEWLDLEDSGDWSRMGRDLAQLHLKNEQGMFGHERDNYIGATLQPNRWHKKWDMFFAEERIGWQLQLLEEKGFHFIRMERFIDKVKTLLHSHTVEPALVHGDLWRGNMGFAGGLPCIFDPACYYGDRETDIAMTRLFGALPVEFYTAYEEVYPLPHDYESREPLYQLYHVLNHANTFAGHYLTEARDLIERIARQG